MAKGVQILGGKETEQILAALGESLGPKVVREHIRAGARVIVKQAQENASHADVTGGVRKSIGTINNKEDKLGVIVTARRSKRYKKGYVAHLLEYGAAPHIISLKKGKDGKKALKMANGGFAREVEHPGIKPSPFMRPAWDTKKDQALKVIREGLKKEVTSNFAKRYKNTRMR